MKRFIIAMAMLECGCMMSSAEDFGTLTLTGKSGQQWTFPAQGLRMVPVAGRMEVYTSAGLSTTLDISQLAGAAFSDSNATGVVGSLESVTVFTLYTMQGVPLGEYATVAEARQHVPAGIYIMNVSGVISKIVL